MFAQLVVAGLLAFPLTSALTIDALVGAVSGSPVNCTWQAGSQDPPTFSIQLVNSIFHDTFAIADVVETALGGISITLPQVPEDSHYAVEAIDISNVNNVYSISGEFTILGTSTSTTTTTSTSTSSTTGSSTLPGTASATLASQLSTVPATTVAASGTATGATASPTSFNSGARAIFEYGTAPAAVALLAMAGAALAF